MRTSQQNLRRYIDVLGASSIWYSAYQRASAYRHIRGVHNTTDGSGSIAVVAIHLKQS